MLPIAGWPISMYRTRSRSGAVFRCDLTPGSCRQIHVTERVHAKDDPATKPRDACRFKTKQRDVFAAGDPLCEAS